MKVFKNILTKLITVILIIIILVLGAYASQAIIIKKDTPDIFGFAIFKVETGSMSGTFEIGDYVIVKLTNDVNENDIITYKQEESFITHRIIKMQDNQIVTKGDSNNAEDKPISNNDVVGKVVYIFKNVEIWKKVFTTPYVIILISLTIIIFLIAVFYPNKKDCEVNKKNSELNKKEQE